MEFAILPHAEAPEPRLTFEASDAAGLRRGLSGHHAGGVLAVRWHDRERPGGGWQLVWPLRDGRPLVTSYLTIPRGLCPASDARVAWEAATATAAYCREHASQLRGVLSWVHST